MMVDYLRHFIVMATCREVFHGLRWLNDERFYSPMIFLPDGTHVFVRDCVDCRHPQLEIVNCLIVKFFVKVSYDCACMGM